VRRGPTHPYDLTPAEVATILSAGLGLMAVQHVESAVSWQPTPAKGDAYGAAAVAHARELALPDGAMLWCDLEGVAEGTPADDVVAYVNGWYDVVSTAGYLPGLYIGWHAGLDADALYRRLRMQHYWAAYNLNSDELPAVRGVQMHQWAVTPETRAKDVPNGITFPFQVDTVLADKLGGLPALTCGGAVSPPSIEGAARCAQSLGRSASRRSPFFVAPYVRRPLRRRGEREHVDAGGPSETGQGLDQGARARSRAVRRRGRGRARPGDRSARANAPRWRMPTASPRGGDARHGRGAPPCAPDPDRRQRRTCR
jgi:hypothetical protein